MMQKILVLIIIMMSLNSCFVADAYLLDEEEPETSLQQKAEESVHKYVGESSADLVYDPYGYSEAKIVKPIQIAQLESLENKIKTAKDTIAIQFQIDSLQALIDTHNIQREIHLDHFFTLQDSTGDLSILESKFVLNEDLSVNRVDPEIILLNADRFATILEYYFYEYTIFLAETYQRSKELSREFYQFFKAELENIEDSKRKSDFLEHVLDMCLAVKQTGNFDQQAILEAIVRKYIVEERTDIKNYESIQFSQLFEKGQESEEQTELSGYYFFHKFSGSFAGVQDTNVVLVEFTPYYEIGNIFQMEPPFEQYFNN